MKETFITTGGMPGTRDFFATMFTIESEKAGTPSELKTLAKRAIKMYAVTEEGAEAYNDNSENFTWNDLVNEAENADFVKICDSLGLKISWLGSTCSDELWVDGNEQLMEGISVDVENIIWTPRECMWMTFLRRRLLTSIVPTWTWLKPCPMNLDGLSALIP